MAFGLKQINNPTPRSKSILIDVIVGILSIVNAWMTTAAFISHHISDIVGSIITGLLIPSLLLIKRFFGEEVKTNVVQADQVTEIKDK